LQSSVFEKNDFDEHFLGILERKRKIQTKKLLIPQSLLDFEKVYIQAKVCFVIIGFEKNDSAQHFLGILGMKRKIQRKKLLIAQHLLDFEKVYIQAKVCFAKVVFLEQNDHFLTF
jgi:hypothetical protein